MPNQHAKDKRILAIQIKRTLHAQLVTLAKSHGVLLSILVRRILEEACENVELTAEDYEQIAKDIKQAGGG